MSIGPFEVLVVVAILLLVFGPAALPRITKNLGKSVGSFQHGLRDADRLDEVQGSLEREESRPDDPPPVRAKAELPASAPPPEDTPADHPPAASGTVEREKGGGNEP